MGIFRERKSIQIHGEPDSYSLCCSQNVSFHLSDHSVSDPGLDLIFWKNALKQKLKIYKSIPVRRQFRTQNQMFNITIFRIYCCLCNWNYTFLHLLVPFVWPAVTQEVCTDEAQTYHCPHCSLFKKHTAQNRDYVIQRAIFRAQIWGNFHENSRRAKSSFRIIQPPMLLIENMSYLKFGKNKTAARPFFPLGHLLGNISAKTESNLW